jgi:type I restriction enzyme S subunit
MNCKDIQLGDFASFKYGKMPNKKKMNENGKYPVFSGYRIVGMYDEYNVEEGQLVIVARGVGGTGDVKLAPARCYLTNLSIAVDVNESVARAKYLYYLYQLNNLRYLDSGSAQSQITIGDLQKVIVPVPDLETQDKIIHLLELYDEKIDVNEEINNNLAPIPCVARIAALAA